MGDMCKVPELRFGEFSGEWEEKKLIELSKNGFTNGAFNDPKKVGSGYRIINVKDMYVDGTIDISNLSKVALDEKEYLNNRVQYGDIFFTRSSLVKEGIAYSNVNLTNAKDLTFDGHLIRMRPNKQNCSSIFLYYNFITSYARKQFIIRGKTTTMTTIGQEDIASVKIVLPSKQEQEKIASFLSAVDTKIEQLSTKTKLLQAYKKGIMQKIFSQELRFKDDDGSEFPKWVEKRLGEVFNFLRGSLLSKADIIESGRNKCIHYGELFTTYNEIIFDIKSATNINDGQLSRKGDILMPSSDVTPQGLATASALLEENVVIGGDINILRPIDTIDSIFISYFLNDHKKEIMKLVTGTTVKHIYNKDIAKLIVNLPSLKEQKKIANFLSSIDTKIGQTQKELEQTKTFKKALLQKMFV